MQEVFRMTYVDVYVIFAFSRFSSQNQKCLCFRQKTQTYTRDSAGACVVRLGAWLDGQSCTFKRVEVFDAQIRWILDKRHTNNEQMRISLSLCVCAVCMCTWLAARELIPYTHFQVYQTHEFLMSHAEVNGFVSEHLLVVLGIHLYMYSKVKWQLTS